MPKSESAKNRKIARKSTWIAGFVTLFVTPIGYVYTGRYLIAGLISIIWIPLISIDSSEEWASTLLGFLIIGASIENVLAIFRARGEEKQTVQETESQPSNRNLGVEILKLVQQEGEVTMAACVISTGRNVDEIRSTLLELEQNDLIRSGNRDSDGAVVYRIV